MNLENSDQLDQICNNPTQFIGKTIQTDVICAGSGEKEKISISFNKNKNKDYDSNYTSDLINFCKNSGYINESQIVFNNGYISTDHGFAADNPENREFIYEQAYLEGRNNFMKAN